jgi:hypothetical protein
MFGRKTTLSVTGSSFFVASSENSKGEAFSDGLSHSEVGRKPETKARSAVSAESATTGGPTEKPAQTD